MRRLPRCIPFLLLYSSFAWALDQPVVSQNAPTVEVAFVLDTTGSMGGLLEGAKEKIWSIASRIARGQPAPKLRVGLVAYRDRGDAYVVKKFDLSGDLDAVFRELRSFQADGGGDTPEHVGRGLGEAVSGMHWSDDRRTMKMIFVVGDAPPQNYQDGWDYRTWAQKAVKQNIVVNAIRCGGDAQTELAFRDMSRLGEGTFASIGATGGVVAVSTPYDSDLARISSEIATKTAFGGAKEARRESRSRASGMGAMDPAAAADRASFMMSSKSSAAPVAAEGSVDLVAKPEAIARLKDDELPSELQAMAAPARKQALEKMGKERKELETKLHELSGKREAYLSAHVSDKKDSFDAAVMSEVKKKGASFGIAY